MRVALCLVDYVQDIQAEAADDLRREYTGQCCGGSFEDVDARRVVNGSWRGWVVSCKKCDDILAEVDDAT